MSTPPRRRSCIERFLAGDSCAPRSLRAGPFALLVVSAAVTRADTGFLASVRQRYQRLQKQPHLEVTRRSARRQAQQHRLPGTPGPGELTRPARESQPARPGTQCSSHGRALAAVGARCIEAGRGGSLAAWRPLSAPGGQRSTGAARAGGRHASPGARALLRACTAATLPAVHGGPEVQAGRPPEADSVTAPPWKSRRCLTQPAKKLRCRHVVRRGVPRCALSRRTAARS